MIHITFDTLHILLCLHIIKHFEEKAVPLKKLVQSTANIERCGSDFRLKNTA